MPAKWIIYIPRSRKEASTLDEHKDSLVSIGESWQTVVERKVTKAEQSETKYQFYLRCLEESFPGAGEAGDVIYIMGGHGRKETVTVTWPGKYDKPLNAKTIAARFAAEGWGPDFAGRVKIYSCFSSESGFAAELAKELRGKGYEKCRYFGYRDEITMAYVTLDLKKPEHQEAFKGNPKDEGTHRWRIVPGAILGRAKDARDPF